MYNHAPSDYQSPFVLLSQGIVNECVESRDSDVIFRDEWTMAFIGSWQFVGSRNAGHTLVVPRAPYEHLYDLPAEVGHRIHDVTRNVALAMKKAYGCDGVTIWQNNEPAAFQTVWHYHVHVIPRFEDDSFFELLSTMKDSFRFMEPEHRLHYAAKLRSAVNEIRCTA